MKHSNRGAIIALSIGLVVGIVWNGLAGYVVLNPRRVADQIRVWNFHPSAAVLEQVARDTMSPEGKFVFFASDPQVKSKRDFNQICSAATTDTSILGCYLQPTKQIFLYRETDKRLDGTEEVMAAHEMLRAAWDRTGAAERTRLMVKLRRVLAADGDSDLALSARMSAIRHDDPADYDSELYAIVGTEVPAVDPLLEANYARYLTFRRAVTDLNAHATAYVLALKRTVHALVTTMNTLNDTITTEVSDFNAAASALDADISSFNARARRPGGFATQGQFNVARAALVARDSSLTTTAAQINAQIDTFNTDLGKLKALDKTALSLVKSLNIELDPLPDGLSV